MMKETSSAKEETNIFRRPPRQVPWGLFRAITGTIFIYLISQLLASLLISIYPLLMGWDESQAKQWLANAVIAQFVYVGLTALLTFIFLRFLLLHLKSGFKALGWRQLPSRRDVGYALSGFGAYFVLLWASSSFIGVLVPSLNSGQKQDLGFNTSTHGFALILTFVALAIITPLVEETLVRGYLYSGLRSKMRVLPAMIITSVLFATAHLQFGTGKPLLWMAGLDTFVLSVVLVYLRERTGRLYASIGLHMLKNTLAFMALFVLHIT